jgi:hypothetical protein
VAVCQRGQVFGEERIMKKPWTKKLTKDFVRDTKQLIRTINAFKSFVEHVAEDHIKPETGSDCSGKISDSKQDLQDCLDGFFQ